MLYPHDLEEKIGFDTIREKLKENCIGSLGAAYADKMQYLNDSEQIKKLLRQTAEFKAILENPTPFPTSNFIDVSDHLKKARIEGAFLSEYEFHEIQLSLNTINDCLNFFKEAEEDAYPELKKLLGLVNIDPGLTKRIRKVIDENGRMKDSASRELQEVRYLKVKEQTRLRKVLDQILKKAQHDGMTPDDVSITIRGGRMVIPVLAEYKRQIKGFIHDESGTGQTVYLEPAEVLDINNEIRDLTYQENREMTRILTELTDYLRPSIQPLRQAYNFLGLIDFIRAKAKLALTLKGAEPKLDKSQVIHWYHARHPILLLSSEGKLDEVVPFDIHLDYEQRVLVISGPNAGGKSVVLKTVALLQYMVQCGLLVPAGEGSTFGVFRDIFIDIGDQQSLENDLSTYSSRLSNMKHFAKFATQKTLFLIDEMGSGTEPKYGGAIAQAVMEKLLQQKSFGIATTHYDNLKQYAQQTDGLINGAMLFDREHLQPLYQLVIGQPGHSFALEMAQKIGLPEEIIDRAKEEVGEKQIHLDQLIKDLEYEKEKYDQENQSLKEKNKRLEQTVEDYEGLRQKLDREKKSILEDAKKEGREIVKSANKKIENTIQSIKESQATKEATQQARETIKELEEKELKPDPSIKKKPVNGDKKQPDDSVSKSQGPVQVGDIVKLKDSDTEGEIMEIKGESAIIAIGSLRSTIKLNKLEKSSKRQQKEKQKATSASKGYGNYDLVESKSHFSTQLDIRGKRAEEALPIVRDFVDQGIMFDAKELRIVHGKGTGALRQTIRHYLQSLPDVASAADEHVEQGGAGVTIVNIK